MYNNVSGCYYHPNKLSVAVCSECGHGLCRDCIVKGRSGKTLCIDCANRELKQEHKEYQRLLRENGGRFRTGKEFLLPGIIGIVLCVVVTFLMISDGQSFSSSGKTIAVVDSNKEAHNTNIQYKSCSASMILLPQPNVTAAVNRFRFGIPRKT